MHDHALNQPVSFIPGDSPEADAIRNAGLVTPVDHRVLKVRDAAREIGVHVRTMYGWIERGLVETRYLPSGITLVVMASVIKTQKLEKQDGESGR